MTHPVIKTNNYILLTSDEEIKEGDYYYDQNYPNQIYIRSNDNKFYIGPKKIIAHLPLGDSAGLKIPLLPPLPMTFPTIECIGDNLWEELTGGQEVSVNRADWSFGFGIGYNKAKEKYKFTEEDVIKIVEKSRETGLTAEYLMLSLSQAKLPTHFQPQYERWDHKSLIINGVMQGEWIFE